MSKNEKTRRVAIDAQSFVDFFSGLFVGASVWLVPFAIGYSLLTSPIGIEVLFIGYFLLPFAIVLIIVLKIKFLASQSGMFVLGAIAFYPIAFGNFALWKNWSNPPPDWKFSHHSIIEPLGTKHPLIVAACRVACKEILLEGLAPYAIELNKGSSSTIEWTSQVFTLSEGANCNQNHHMNDFAHLGIFDKCTLVSEKKVSSLREALKNGVIYRDGDYDNITQYMGMPRVYRRTTPSPAKIATINIVEDGKIGGELVRWEYAPVVYEYNSDNARSSEVLVPQVIEREAIGSPFSAVDFFRAATGSKSQKVYAALRHDISGHLRRLEFAARRHSLSSHEVSNILTQVIPKSTDSVGKFRTAVERQLYAALIKTVCNQTNKNEETEADCRLQLEHYGASWFKL